MTRTQKALKYLEIADNPQSKKIAPAKQAKARKVLQAMGVCDSDNEFIENSDNLPIAEQWDIYLFLLGFYPE